MVPASSESLGAYRFVRSGELCQDGKERKNNQERSNHNSSGCYCLTIRFLCWAVHFGSVSQIVNNSNNKQFLWTLTMCWSIYHFLGALYTSELINSRNTIWRTYYVLFCDRHRNLTRTKRIAFNKERPTLILKQKLLRKR